MASKNIGEKMDGATRNLESDNVSALAAAFPEVVADGKVDFEKLRLILGEDVDDSEERYSFNWPGKRDAIKMAISRTTGTLRPDKENSKDWDTTQNMFIEGDNLEVLRSLQNSYRGKVKMIYIDPPYNTGKDFVYKDDFKDNIRNYKENASLEGQSNPDTAGRYHTNWLNMMYPRLRLAKNLLKDDGVIFISIDDHEVHNLRKLCDEIFGEDNLVSHIAHKSRASVSNDKIISSNHNHILLYTKSYEKTFADRAQFGVEQDLAAFTEVDEKGLYKLVPVDGPGGVKKGNPYYTFEGITGYWRFSEKTMREKHSEGLVIKRGKSLQQKYYKMDAEKSKRTITSWWDKNFYISTATRRLSDLLGGNFFDTPKPVELVELMLKLSTNDSDVILDFFAGSATTAHAVMDLNVEDGGNRRFIMVQIPESTPESSEAREAGYNIISEISRKRIDLAGEKIKEDNKDKLAERETPLDIGFKAFTLDTTNFREWDTNTTNIEQSLLDALDTFKEGRNDEDALYEVLLKYGVDITEPVEVLTLAGSQVYSLADNYLLVCLEKSITLETIEAMAALKPERVVCYDDGFADEDVKQNSLETLKRAGVTDVRVV